MFLKSQQLQKLRQCSSSLIEEAISSNSFISRLSHLQLGHHQSNDIVKHHNTNEYDVIALGNHIFTGRTIYYGKLTKSALHRRCLKIGINLNFTWNDESLLRESENFYELLYFATKKQIKNPEFYSKAIKIFPPCIIDYANYLPKELDPDLIEEVISRFPVLANFMRENFVIPESVSKKLAEKYEYFYDDKLLKRKIEREPENIINEFEQFKENSLGASLYKTSGIKFSGCLVKKLGIDINEKNFDLFEFTGVEEIINSAKYLNTNCFLTSLLKNNFENFGSDFGYATNKEDPPEQLQELLQAINEANKSKLEKDEMRICTLMYIEFYIFKQALSEKYWHDELMNKNFLINIYQPEAERIRNNYLKNPSVAELYVKYAKKSQNSYLQFVNPFVAASLSRNINKKYRHLHLGLRQDFTRAVLQILEESRARFISLNSLKFLRKLQPMFFCRRLYGKSRNL